MVADSHGCPLRSGLLSYVDDGGGDDRDNDDYDVFDDGVGTER